MNDIYPFLFSDPAEEERQDRQRWQRMRADEDNRRKQRDTISIELAAASQSHWKDARSKLNGVKSLLETTRVFLKNSEVVDRRARAEIQALQIIRQQETTSVPLEKWFPDYFKEMLEAARTRHAEMTAKAAQETDALNRSRELNMNAHREAVVQLILQRSAERAIQQLATSGAWGHSDLPKHVAKTMAPHVRDELGKAPCHRASLEKKIQEG